MSALKKMRSALALWIAGAPADPSAHGGKEAAVPSRPSAQEIDRRILSVFQSMGSNRREWPGKVRLINLDAIRERVGPTWPKLRSRVELLAGKIIKDELAHGDFYLNVGEAEFLVFFADASSQEAKIRSLAIVEAIHQKLLGADERGAGMRQRFAECHVFRAENIPSDWANDQASGLGRQALLERLSRSFPRQAEVLDGRDVAASIQMAVDAIISCAVESRRTGELDPLRERVRHITRSLKTLEPALDAEMAAAAGTQRRDESPDQGQSELGEDRARRGDAVRHALTAAREDTAELFSVLSPGSDRQHGDVLEALAGLRNKRAEREAKKFGSDSLSARQADISEAQERGFEYIPVYRRDSVGHLYQGIYRIVCRSTEQERRTSDLCPAGRQLQDEALGERLLLGHAIQYCAGQTGLARFLLMVPVHVETLRSPNLQRRYSTVLRGDELRTKPRLVIEVVGYRESDNTISIRRAIEELLTHAHAVFVTVPLSGIGNFRQAALHAKTLGIHAMGIDVSDCDASEADIAAALKQVSAVGQQLGISTYANGIGSPTVLAEALAAEIGYVCAPALTPPQAVPKDVERATLDEFDLPARDRFYIE